MAAEPNARLASAFEGWCDTRGRRVGGVRCAAQRLWGRCVCHLLQLQLVRLRGRARCGRRHFRLGRRGRLGKLRWLSGREQWRRRDSLAAVIAGHAGRPARSLVLLPDVLRRPEQRTEQRRPRALRGEDAVRRDPGRDHERGSAKRRQYRSRDLQRADRVRGLRRSNRISKGRCERAHRRSFGPHGQGSRHSGEPGVWRRAPMPAPHRRARFRPSARSCS